MSSSRFLGFPYKVDRFRQPKYLIRYSAYLKHGDVITNEELITTSYNKKLKVYGTGYSSQVVSFRPDQLEYEENEYLEFCGYTPKSMMYRPSKAVPNTLEAKRACTKLAFVFPEHTGEEFRKGIFTPRLMVTGGINTSIEHLKRYWELPRNKLKGANYYIDLIEKIEGEIIRLPQLKTPHKDYIRSVNINERSHAGFMTNLYYGGSKGKSFNTTHKFAKHLYEMIKRFPIKWTGLYELSGRGKDINLDAGDGSPAITRIIMIPEFTLTLIGSMFSQTIGQFLKYDEQNCVFIGRDINKVSKSLIDERFQFLFNNDWKTFDSSITPDLILAACSILRSCFPEDRENDRIWYFLASSLIDKYVVLPKGGVWCIKKGLPSGHPLTSLVETLCNVLSWLDIMYEIWGPGLLKFVKFWLSGDDGRILTMWNDKYKYLDQIVTNVTNLNFKGKVYDRFELQFPYDSKHGVDFLKRIINSDGSVEWRFDLICRKLCIPEWEDMHEYDSLQRFENYVMTAPGREGSIYESLMINLGCELKKQFSKGNANIAQITAYRNRIQSLFTIARRNKSDYTYGFKSKSMDAIYNYAQFLEGKKSIRPYLSQELTLDSFMLRMRANVGLIPQVGIRKGVANYVIDLINRGWIRKTGPPDVRHQDFDTWFDGLEDSVRGFVNDSENQGLGMVFDWKGQSDSNVRDFVYRSL